jgi:hypothetical protein
MSTMHAPARARTRVFSLTHSHPRRPTRSREARYRCPRALATSTQLTRAEATGLWQGSAFYQRSSASGRSHPQPVVRTTGNQHSLRTAAAPASHGHARLQSPFVPRASASEFLSGGEECATLYAEEPEERQAERPSTPLDLLNSPHEANLQAISEPGTSGSHPQQLPGLLLRMLRHWTTAMLAAAVVAAVAVVEVLGLTGYSAPYTTLLDYVRSQLEAGYAMIEPYLTLEVYTTTSFPPVRADSSHSFVVVHHDLSDQKPVHSLYVDGPDGAVDGAAGLLPHPAEQRLPHHDEHR